MSAPETASEDHSTFSDDNINLSVTKKSHCQIKFDVKVAPKAAQAAYQKALKKINKEVNIPGFRKGKAPEQFIIEKFGQTVQKEFVDILLQTGFNDAVQLSHIHPLKDGIIKRPVVHECSTEKGAHFTLEFEAKPTIPKVNLDDIQFEKAIPALVTDEYRDNTLQNLRQQFATYEPILDRGIQENDFIDISLSNLNDPPQEIMSKKRTQVNEAGLPAWLRKPIMGLRAGESFEGVSEEDAKQLEQNPDYQPLPFRAHIHAIYKGILPAIDEELAKKVGLHSAEDLHQKVDERLQQQMQEEARSLEIERLENFLVTHYPIDLPQSYIDINKKARLEKYLKDLQKPDFSEEEYHQLEKMIEESTIYQLQLFFLLRKIAADYQISVSQEDINHELRRLLSQQGGKPNLEFLKDDKLVEQLHNLALDRKIKEFLINYTKQR